jgi:hypothetical protein
MTRVKRLALLVLVLAVVAPGTANASTPCRDRIYNDWYPDGKIATTYTIACYRDALAHIRDDARTYSSLAEDIRSAMQAALARKNGKSHVPTQVGKGGTPKPPTKVHTTRTVPSESPSATDTSTSGQEPVSATVPTTTLSAAPPAAASGGGGVPVPLLVLAALALVLVAAGAAGVVAKRRRA